MSPDLPHSRLIGKMFKTEIDGEISKLVNRINLHYNFNIKMHKTLTHYFLPLNNSFVLHLQELNNFYTFKT